VTSKVKSYTLGSYRSSGPTGGRPEGGLARMSRPASSEEARLMTVYPSPVAPGSERKIL